MPPNYPPPYNPPGYLPAPQPSGTPGYPPQAAPPGYPPAPQGYAPPGYPPAPPGYPPPGYPPPAGPPSGHGPPGYPPPQGQPQSPPPGFGRPGVMSGLDDVDPTGSRLPHFNPNYRYLLQNKKIDFFTGRKSNFVTSEWSILESDDPHLQPGREAKYMIKWDQDMSLPNYKAMLGALYGLSDSEQIKQQITQQVGELAIDPEKQPCRGKLAELRTNATKTKQNTDFTVHNWAPWSGAAPALPTAPAQFGGANPPAVTPQGQYAPQGYSSPGQAAIPPLAAPPPAAQQMPWPPPGWTPHPTAPGQFYRGQEVVLEHDLRARQAQGRA